MRMFASVPAALWEKCKRDILTTWFRGEPSLVRYPDLADDECEYFTFYADYEEDMRLFIAKLPVGGCAIAC